MEQPYTYRLTVVPRLPMSGPGWPDEPVPYQCIGVWNGPTVPASLMTPLTWTQETLQELGPDSALLAQVVMLGMDREPRLQGRISQVATQMHQNGELSSYTLTGTEVFRVPGYPGPDGPAILYFPTSRRARIGSLQMPDLVRWLSRCGITLETTTAPEGHVCEVKLTVGGVPGPLDGETTTTVK